MYQRLLSHTVSLCRQHGFSFVRLDGTLSQKRRAQVIQEFQSSAPDSPAVMLLSLRAGGVGLNLTAASRVFLMEPVSANEEDAKRPSTYGKGLCYVNWLYRMPERNLDSIQ